MHLRQDCVQQDKLRAFDAIGQAVLRMLWEQGVDPSVRAIVDHAPEHAADGDGNLG